MNMNMNMKIWTKWKISVLAKIHTYSASFYLILTWRPILTVKKNLRETLSWKMLFKVAFRCMFYWSFGKKSWQSLLWSHYRGSWYDLSVELVQQLLDLFLQPCKAFILKKNYLLLLFFKSTLLHPKVCLFTNLSCYSACIRVLPLHPFDLPWERTINIIMKYKMHDSLRKQSLVCPRPTWDYKKTWKMPKSRHGREM